MVREGRISSLSRPECGVSGLSVSLSYASAFGFQSLGRAGVPTAGSAPMPDALSTSGGCGGVAGSGPSRVANGATRDGVALGRFT